MSRDYMDINKGKGMTVAMFPVRGQPPHIGHILTLMKLYPLYDEIIIAVTSYTYEGRKPQVLPPHEVVRVLEEVFKHLPKYKVIYVDEGFNTRTSFADLPDFDVLVSGDWGLIRNTEKFGIKNIFVPRSTIYGLEISSTLIRKALNDAD